MEISKRGKKSPILVTQTVTMSKKKKKSPSPFSSHIAIEAHAWKKSKTKGQLCDIS